MEHWHGADVDPRADAAGAGVWVCFAVYILALRTRTHPEIDSIGLRACRVCYVHLSAAR